jgi:hypothetical protein
MNGNWSRKNENKKSYRTPNASKHAACSGYFQNLSNTFAAPLICTLSIGVGGYSGESFAAYRRAL